MAADFSGQDPKSLWKGQEQEPDPVTLDQIRAIVRRYDNRDRRIAIVLAFVMVGVGAVGAQAWFVMHDPVMTILFVGGEMTTCLLAYRMLFPARDAAEPGGAYLRRRLRLRLAHLQGGYVWVLLPLVPCILWSTWIMYQRHWLPVMNRLAPFVIVLVGLVWIAVRTRQRARKVRAELAELDRLLER
jgi:uncharacterized membrane protein